MLDHRKFKEENSIGVSTTITNGNRPLALCLVPSPVNISICLASSPEKLIEEDRGVLNSQDVNCLMRYHNDDIVFEIPSPAPGPVIMEDGFAGFR